MGLKAPHYYSIFQKKYKYGKGKGDGEGFVNLTSLLDVLIILLFFLLMSYNPTEMEFSTLNDVNPPDSETLEMGTLATVVQVSPSLDVTLEKEKIGNLSDESTSLVMGEKLKIAFEIQKAKFEKKKSTMQNFRNINFIMDGKVQYEQLEKMMLLSAKSGYENYKFIVRSKVK